MEDDLTTGRLGYTEIGGQREGKGSRGEGDSAVLALPLLGLLGKKGLHYPQCLEESLNA